MHKLVLYYFCISCSFYLNGDSLMPQLGFCPCCHQSTRIRLTGEAHDEGHGEQPRGPEDVFVLPHPNRVGSGDCEGEGLAPVNRSYP